MKLVNFVVYPVISLVPEDKCAGVNKFSTLKL